MKRLLLNDLLEWKESKYRKPLILEGVRQVGKTWLLKEFGRQNYKNVAYFDFEATPEYKTIFETTKTPARVIENLTLASGQVIKPKETLIFFDEIQMCPSALTALKYFCDDAPEYHVVSAGSLLGIALAKPSSFPVGKVNFMKIYPMNFTEFLMASGNDNYASFLDSIDEIKPIHEVFFDTLQEKLKMYYVTGGMPESIRMWTQEKDIVKMQKALSDIIDSHERDFAKYPSHREYPKISMVWKSIPSQLAKENKKFLYNVLKEGARAKDYEDALQWLVNAHLVNKIYRSCAPRLPIMAYDDLAAFKLYLVDVGLLIRMSSLEPSAFIEGNRLFTEFKGALSENYVLQSLVSQFEVQPRYWAVDNPHYEIDFIIQRGNDIIPIEVKSERNVESKSLKKFKEKFSDDIKIRVRFSLNNLKLDGDVLNIPLFMADHTDKLIGLALKKMKNR